MTDEDKLGCIIAVVLALFLIFISAAITHGLCENSWQRSAINAGVAEWTIDAETGEREFKWKP